jgi:hypothetical protein
MLAQQDIADILFRELRAAGLVGRTRRQIVRNLIRHHIDYDKITAALKKLRMEGKVQCAVQLRLRGSARGRRPMVWFAVQPNS